MPKTRTPFFSFRAFGSVTRTLTARRRKRDTILEHKPIPKDAKTSSQLAWRTMYQACTDLWHTLSASEKAQWETDARRKHMTGYNYYMSLCLRPNPGIYLPLAGGTMSGDIDMDSNRITALPQASANEEPLRKTDWLSTLFSFTDGTLLLGQGAASGPAQISGWQKIAQTTCGADVSYVDFSSLDINTDNTYILFAAIENSAASGSHYFLFINLDTTITNYYSQYIQGNSTTVSAARANSPAIMYLPTAQSGAPFVVVSRDPQGYARAIAYNSAYNPASIRVTFRAIAKTATVSNITSIRIQSASALAIAQDSKFLLCKPRTS